MRTSDSRRRRSRGTLLISLEGFAAMLDAARQHDHAQFDGDVDAILAVYGGDARAALRAVVDELARARADTRQLLEHVSEGYVRGRRRAG